jgi:L-ascorbate metabolism protein UlaG (beta-lactamase superfamily)
MDITYLGHASFLLRGNSGKVVTDPYDGDMMKHVFPKTEADIVTISHAHGDHNSAGAVVSYDPNTSNPNPLVLTMPGEYEKKGIRIQGFATFHDKNQGADRGKNVVYKITIDDVDILHCGDLGHMLKSDVVDEIGNVDVLLIPVGGFYTIGPDEAVDVVSKLEPSVVIPMHYKATSFNPEIMDNLAPVENFLDKIGSEVTKPGKKFSIKKSDITEEELRVVVLEMA